MPEFITNILAGVKQWVESKLDEITYVVSLHLNTLTNRVTTLESSKQDVLTPGNNIEIDSGGTVSVTGIADWALALNKPTYAANEITNAVSSTSVMTIWKGTQNQYNAIVSPSDTTFYIIVEPLSLTITSGDTIQYDPNMTWEQWIGSSYNTLGWVTNTDYVADSSGSSNVLFAGGNFVVKTDTINASLTYSLQPLAEVQ